MAISNVFTKNALKSYAGSTLVVTVKLLSYTCRLYDAFNLIGYQMENKKDRLRSKKNVNWDKTKFFFTVYLVKGT